MTFTGHDKLDAALADFFAQDKLLQAASPSSGRPQVRVSDLADPELATGRCGRASNELAQHLRRRGIEATVTDNMVMLLRSAHADVARLMFPGIENDLERIPSPEDHGYADRSQPGLSNHCAVLVRAGGDTLLIDITAAQYGYAPVMIQRQMPDGSWERDLARPRLDDLEAERPSLPHHPADIDSPAL
jgi:hypothetical protein